MNTVVENLSEPIAALFRRCGFWTSTSILMMIGVIFAFYMIKKRYENVYISVALKEECELLRKYNDNKELTSLLARSKYLLLGNIYVSVIKVLLGLLYGLVLNSNAMSFIDFNAMSFPFRESGRALFSPFDKKAFYVIVFSLLYLWLQVTINKSLSKDASIDTTISDFFIAITVFIVCLLGPCGALVYILGFTVLEYLVTMPNLFSAMREEKQERMNRRLSSVKEAFKNTYKPPKTQTHSSLKKKNKKKK